MEPDPPFLKTYKALFDSQLETSDTNQAAEAEECDLPLIDLSRLNRESESEQCKKDIMAAASEWGFFQVVNHGVSSTLLHRIRELQVNVFQLPFVKKASEKLLDLSPENYRWGSPRPTSVRQLSWSEAYHIPLTPANGVTKTSTRYFNSFYLFLTEGIYSIFLGAFILTMPPARLITSNMSKMLTCPHFGISILKAMKESMLNSFLLLKS